MAPFIPPEHRPDVEVGLRIIAQILVRDILAEHHERLAKERLAHTNDQYLPCASSQKRLTDGDKVKQRSGRRRQG